MGRCKLQIKRIENTTNRQVTYSKRRNGILKKAHELSVLCDVDIALIMFSPSGRLSLFSGHKRIEDVLARFVNLPEHERGRLQNHESIQRTIERMKIENDLAYQVAVCMTPGRVQSQLEELQQEINNLHAQLFEAERKLRNYEGEALFLNNMHEVEYYERFLEESLNRVRAYRMQQSEDANDIFDNGTNQCMDWIPHHQSAEPQSQVLNFLDTNGIVPLRGQTQQFTECFPANTTNYVSLMNNNGLDASGDHGKNDIVLSIQYDSTGVNLSQWNGGTGRQVI